MLQMGIREGHLGSEQSALGEAVPKAQGMSSEGCSCEPSAIRQGMGTGALMRGSG